MWMDKFRSHFGKFFEYIVISILYFDSNCSSFWDDLIAESKDNIQKLWTADLLIYSTVTTFCAQILMHKLNSVGKSEFLMSNVKRRGAMEDLVIIRSLLREKTACRFCSAWISERRRDRARWPLKLLSRFFLGSRCTDETLRSLMYILSSSR